VTACTHGHWHTPVLSNTMSSSEPSLSLLMIEAWADKRRSVEEGGGAEEEEWGEGAGFFFVLGMSFARALAEEGGVGEGRGLSMG